LSEFVVLNFPDCSVQSKKVNLKKLENGIEQYNKKLEKAEKR